MSNIMNKVTSELTQEIFWENFWRNINLPALVNMQFKNDRVIAEKFLKYIPKNLEIRKNAIEIGCAPGKWLIFLNQKLNFDVAGIEYVEEAAKVTLENFKSNNIPNEQYKIIIGDFLEEPISETYDCVYSLGFIEHFDNYYLIMNKHLALLKNDGYLIFGIPNFRGVNYFIQKLIDYYLDDKILSNHNLDVMNLCHFRKFSDDNNLEVKFARYVGGFEPALFNYSAITNRYYRLLFKVVLKVFSILFGRCNWSFLSSYIFVVYHKQNTNI